MGKATVYFLGCWLAVASWVFGQAEMGRPESEVTAISMETTEEHEVRFTSGTTLCVEGLVQGQWCGRYWAADGRINFTYWRFAEPAFKIGIKTEPNAAETLLTDGWNWAAGRELPRTERGGRHVVVELVHPAAKVAVKVHTLLDGTAVMVRWLEITNQSERPIALTSLAPWTARLWDAPGLGPLGPFAVSTSSPWMSFAWKKLDTGVTTVENEYANGYDDAFFMARNESNGEYFICQLAWSANYRIRFDCQMDEKNTRAGLVVDVGPRAADALRVIAAGETIVSPAVHLGHLAGDVDATVQAMHEHIRKSVLPRRNREHAWRIQYNTPGDQGYFTGENFNETNIKKCIDVAADIGCELFLLDCPWNDRAGEWAPSAQRFPNGLKPLVEYAHQKGLLFGMQTEIEGGRGDWTQSPVARNHPDWFGDQNIMRLDLPAPAAYMEGELARLFDEFKPDLYRNEFIPNVSKLRQQAPGTEFYVTEWISAEREGFKENCFWRHYENWGRVWERLRGKYPDLIFQQCANCGTREDLGTVGRFDETNTAEGPTQNMIGIIAGKTLCIPPEIIAMGYGTAKERGPLDTFLRATYTLVTPQYVTGIAPTPEELSPILREKCRHYAAIYKKFIRPILPVSKMYHHEPSFTGSSGPWGIPWLALEYAAPDGSRGWATIVHQNGSENPTYVFRPRGLRRDRSYEVTFDSSGAKVRIEGQRLIQEGLSLYLPGVMSSELLLFEAQ